MTKSKEDIIKEMQAVVEQMRFGNWNRIRNSSHVCFKINQKSYSYRYKF